MAVIFEEPVLTLEEKIGVMQRFTEAYQQDHPSVAIREAHCLRAQFPAVMGPIRPDDYFAGRLGGLPVGFNPQAECMELGYYLDEDEMKRLLGEAKVPAQREALRALRDFWREHRTLNRIKALYDEPLLETLADKHYVYERAAAYPLYRMSGTQLDFGKLLRHGAEGLHRLLDARMAQAREQELHFLSALHMVLDVYSDTCLHYRDEALASAASAGPARAAHLHKLAGILEKSATQPAQGFEQALQMVLIYWLLSGSFNFGRMDDYLAGYYTADVDSGVLTEEQALDALVGMWRAMTARGKPYDTRVIIGGEGRSCPEAGDRFSLLAIRASMRTRDVTPQLTLRIAEDTPQQVIDLALEALASGTTFPMLYPDRVNIPAVMKAFGVSRETAQQYAPYGCGEYVLFHQSIGTPSGLINLLKALELTCNNGYDLHTGEPLGLHNGYLWQYPDFESLWNAYAQQVDVLMEQLARQEKMEYDGAAEDCAFLYFSLLFDDCIDRAKPLLSGGVRHLGGTVESYGNVNTADSLTAIRSLVFDTGRIQPRDLLRAMENNFEGDEALRQALLDAPKYGNDDEGADAMAIRVHEQVCDSAIRAGKAAGLDSYLVVIINNNANTVLGKHTAASADGRLAHTFMANANCPFRGNDRQGVTAMLNSLSKMRCDIHAGCVQNLKFSREMFQHGGAAAKALLQVYFDQGGSQAMVSVVGREDLENAIRHPEQYRHLIVRVGGFSARFVELARSEQQEILLRTLY